MHFGMPRGTTANICPDLDLTAFIGLEVQLSCTAQRTWLSLQYPGMKQSKDFSTTVSFFHLLLRKDLPAACSGISTALSHHISYESTSFVYPGAHSRKPLERKALEHAHSI